MKSFSKVFFSQSTKSPHPSSPSYTRTQSNSQSNLNNNNSSFSSYYPNNNGQDIEMGRLPPQPRGTSRQGSAYSIQTTTPGLEEFQLEVSITLY